MPAHESIAEKSPVAAPRAMRPMPAIAAAPATAGDAVLQMQRAYGNRCVQRMIQQARQGEGERDVPDEVETSIQAARGGGQALDRAVRAQLEPALGADFGGVRIHADRRADGLSQALGARAFTTGQDIFFRQGEYNPGSGRGRELLAHELTHVVQQNGGAVQTKLTVNAPGDQYEEEADRVARAVMRQEQQPAQGTATPRETTDQDRRGQVMLGTTQLFRQSSSEASDDDATTERKPEAGVLQRQTDEDDRTG